MAEGEIVTLASIANGAAMELFDRELKHVIANIGDPNTLAKTKRSIDIKIEIQPDDDRNIGFATVKVSSKLAGVKPVSSTLYFGKKDGKYIAVTNNISQPSIFDEPVGEKDKVVPLTAVRSQK